MTDDLLSFNDNFVIVGGNEGFRVGRDFPCPEKVEIRRNYFTIPSGVVPRGFWRRTRLRRFRPLIAQLLVLRSAWTWMRD